MHFSVSFRNQDKEDGDNGRHKNAKNDGIGSRLVLGVVEFYSAFIFVNTDKCLN